MYLPCYLLFSCFLTHHSAGMQAELILVLVCATLGLRNSCKGVRKTNLCYGLPIPNMVCITQTNSKLCVFVYSKFVQNVHVC